MDNGWIKLHRELLGKSIWLTSTPEQKVLLITLLLMANHEANEWEFQGKKYTVQPGQFVTSLESLHKTCGKGISVKNIRTALLRFEKYEFLTSKSTNRNRLITIVNWELYQIDKENGQANRQATGKQPATNKNDKNEKNKYNAFFNKIWSEYPSKKGKTAIKDPAKKNLFKVGEADLLKAISNYKSELEANQWKQPMNGSTFFNGRYQDYLPKNFESTIPEQRRRTRILNEE